MLIIWEQLQKYSFLWMAQYLPSHFSGRLFTQNITKETVLSMTPPHYWCISHKVTSDLDEYHACQLSNNIMLHVN